MTSFTTAMLTRTTEDPCIGTSAPYISQNGNTITLTPQNCEHSVVLVRATPASTMIPREFIYTAPFDITEDTYISAYNLRAGYKLGDDASGKLFEYEIPVSQEPFWIKPLVEYERNSDGTLNTARANRVDVPADSGQGFEYSYDGVNWVKGQTYNNTGYTLIFPNVGEKVYFRHSGFTSYYTSTSGGSWYKAFAIRGDCEVGGNILSLYFGSDFTGQTRFNLSSSDTSYGFSKLFYMASTQLNWVVSAEKLVFPYNAVGGHGFSEMFRNCVHLTTAPSIIQTEQPSDYMMYRMFYGCTALQVAPDLPALRIGNHSYDEMFYGCSALNYVKAMITTTPGSGYTNNWLSGVSLTGTFVKNSNTSWNVSGASGVPSGWTIQTETPNSYTYQRITSISELRQGDTFILAMRYNTSANYYTVPYTNYGINTTIWNVRTTVEATYSYPSQIIVGDYTNSELVISTLNGSGEMTITTREGYLIGINDTTGSTTKQIVIGSPSSNVWTIETNTSGSNQVPSNYSAFKIYTGNNKCIGRNTYNNVQTYNYSTYNNQNGSMLACDIFRKVS